MYTVMKALNNNSVLVQDETGTSMIFLGKGIGFGKKNGDSIACGAGVEVYRFTETNDHGDAMEIIQGVNPLFIEVAGKILKLAQIRFHEVDKNILLPLADHIAFSIERMKANMDISNPFASEMLCFTGRNMRLLYRERRSLRKCAAIPSMKERLAISHCMSILPEVRIRSQRLCRPRS
ncbi:MAG: CAT RNA binding domain-containing protein [Clostridium sp.]